jgi:beta-glucosidase
MDEIDATVSRIVETKFELGLFEHPYVNEGSVSGVFETQTQRSLARELARQSMVLLKNNGVLPLSKPHVIAVIGPNADSSRNMLADYSYSSMLELMTYQPRPGAAFISALDEHQLRANSVQIPTILESVRTRAGKPTEVLYAKGCDVNSPDRSGFNEAIEMADRADVVILVLGDKSGLIPDCTTGETRDRAELGLPGVQEELAKAVAAVGKPVVAVLINGRPISSPWLKENAQAILEAWLPGEEGANAIAEVLFGDMNPGGKLPVTIARSVGQVPMRYNNKPSGGHSNWYGDYVDLPASPLYAFGHGLSYTAFSYSDLQLSSEKVKPGDDVKISLTLGNIGPVSGDEVVQLYVCDEYASIPRPVKELKAFSRVRLGPGESCRLSFCLPVDMLAFHDENMDLVVETGKIKVMLGSSSEDIRLESEFEITSGTGKTAVKERVFVCPVEMI